MVMSGVVELVTSLSGDSQPDVPADALTVDLDDSLTLDCSAVAGVTVAAEACEDGKLHIDSSKVSRPCRRATRRVESCAPRQEPFAGLRVSVLPYLSNSPTSGTSSCFQMY